MRPVSFGLALIASAATASPTTSFHPPAKSIPPSTLHIVLQPLPAPAAQTPSKSNYPPPEQVFAKSLPAAPAGNPPASMQWLYGSGEAAALSIASYRAFQNYAVAIARHRPTNSVVLSPDSTLREPHFVPCGRKPLAVVLDVDETTLLNAGYEYDQAAQKRAYDPKRWADWERTGISVTHEVPGVFTALKAIRAAGIKVIFISNRSLENVAKTELALDEFSLGPARHLKELFVEGDVAGGSAKDPRRALVASRYCVVAMAGDQLGDFTDLFNSEDASPPARRSTAMAWHISKLWGNGWFVLPNPVYGTGVKGNFYEVFPSARWTDPAGGQ
jgi:5'-nucleotidase (lipoprotein e(P4) family)